MFQRDERLSRAGRRANVEIFVLTDKLKLKLLGLVRGWLVKVENGILVNLCKLATVRGDLGAELVPEIAVKVT